MSADPRLVSTRTTRYRGASTVTVFFSYLPLTASPAPEARAPKARAPEARAPKARAPEARAPETRRARAGNATRARPGLLPRPARRGHADHLRTDAPRDTPPPTPHTHARSGLWSLIIIRHSHADVITRPKMYLRTFIRNNHLVSFIKVEGLFVSYIVAIFDTIKSNMTV